jgi:hydroxymethylbilane synthase
LFCNQLFDLSLMKRHIIIGARGSRLAVWQANWAAESLRALYSDITTELVLIKTKGDRILDAPLARVGGKGLFVKEIEEALLDRKVDLAVHSMKDMPADIPAGLMIGAVPEREHPGDVFISRTGCPFSDLPEGAGIGTSSLRRAAQLRHVRPDVTIVPLRGNVDTRLAKLASGVSDAIVLAAAGMKRLNQDHQAMQYLDYSVMLPAVGQGALCIEIREHDPEMAALISPLNHPETRTAVSSERAFLRKLEGGCQVPIAAHGYVTGDSLTLTGLICDTGGLVMIRETLTGDVARAEQIGTELADMLLARGADHILDKLKAEGHAYI